MHFSAPKSAPVHESVSADRMVSQLSKLILYITLSRKKKQVVLYQKGVQVSLLTRHNNIHILPLIPFNDYPHSSSFCLIFHSPAVTDKEHFYPNTFFNNSIISSFSVHIFSMNFDQMVLAPASQ